MVPTQIYLTFLERLSMAEAPYYRILGTITHIITITYIQITLEIILGTYLVSIKVH